MVAELAPAEWTVGGGEEKWTWWAFLYSFSREARVGGKGGLSYRLLHLLGSLMIPGNEWHQPKDH